MSRIITLLHKYIVQDSCFLVDEFVFANLLVGNLYETLQVYFYNMRNGSSHFTSAMVISYFVVVLLLTLLANALGREKE